MNNIPEVVYALIAMLIIVFMIVYMIAYIMLPFNVKAIRRELEKITKLLKKGEK